MNKVMYADCDMPQSLMTPPPVVEAKKKERPVRKSEFESKFRIKAKPKKPIEGTKVWVLYSNSQPLATGL